MAQVETTNNAACPAKSVNIVKSKRYYLPLTTGMTDWVQLMQIDGDYFLGCYEKQEDKQYKFLPKLKDANLVNNTTEKGPCLFLICTNGEYEFQTDSKEVFNAWMTIFVDCGVEFVSFDKLFRLRDFLGEGSFAKVYVGQQMYTGERVCVKAVDKKKVKDSNIFTEIEILRKISHPYIINLFAAYEKEDTVYLVLEYLRGGELFDWLSENGPYSEPIAKEAMRRILQALQCMHQKGIVHRDLKTENLILEHQGCPASLKIIDFGLASTLGSSTMRMRCGSPGYVAPEILEDRPYGVKVDMFSAGVILFTILSGYPPFRGTNVKEILRKNLQCRVTFNHSRWAPVSQSAMDLILWMTNRDSEKRCSATQALTHPWFERIPSTVPNANPSADKKVHALKPQKPEQSATQSTAPSVVSSNISVTTGSTKTEQSAKEVSKITKPQQLTPITPNSNSPTSLLAHAVATACKAKPPESPMEAASTAASFKAVPVSPAQTGSQSHSASGRPRLASNSSQAGSPVRIQPPKVPDTSSDSKESPSIIQSRVIRTVVPTSRGVNIPSSGGVVKQQNLEAPTQKPAVNVNFERNKRRSKTGASNKKETSQLVQSHAQTNRGRQEMVKFMDDAAAAAVAAAGITSLTRASPTSSKNTRRPSQSIVSCGSVAHSVVMSDCKTPRQHADRTQSVLVVTERIVGLPISYEDLMVDEGFVGLEGIRQDALNNFLMHSREAEVYDRCYEELTASVPCLPSTDEMPKIKRIVRNWKREASTDRLCKEAMMEVTSKYFRACRYGASRSSRTSICSSRTTLGSVSSKQSSPTKARFITGYQPQSLPPFCDDVISPLRKDSKSSKTVRFARTPSQDSMPRTPSPDNAARRRRIKSLPGHCDSVKAAAIAAQTEEVCSQKSEIVNEAPRTNVTDNSSTPEKTKPTSPAACKDEGYGVWGGAFQLSNFLQKVPGVTRLRNSLKENHADQSATDTSGKLKKRTLMFKK